MTRTAELPNQSDAERDGAAITRDSRQNGIQDGTFPAGSAGCPPPVDRQALSEEIQAHLTAIGLNGARSEGVLPKESIRHIHRVHRRAAQQRILRVLGHKLDRLLDEFADGDEVNPESIQPELVEAVSQRHTGDVFRFASLRWSIPVSQGYGRRLRFLVRDRSNGKLIGIFALGDPVFNLRVRDEWIGWNQAERRDRLVNLMDAYVVGAVPPYSDLLGGKLVASLIASKEVGQKFRERYGSTTGLISKKKKRARLSLVTVTSALGRSAMYNRLRLRASTPDATGSPVVNFLRLGETTGYGHFQITDDLFSQLRRVLAEDGHTYADGHQFGDGPNWRIRVARQGIESLGMNADQILRHGIKREVYALPIATNCLDFLSGRQKTPSFDYLTVGEISDLARQRWLIPRGSRKPEFKQFRKVQLQGDIEKMMDDK